MNHYSTPGTRLVDATTGRTIPEGTAVVDFRGDAARVVGWRMGSHPGSTGRVLVTPLPATTDDFAEREYFPSVFGARVEYEPVR